MISAVILTKNEEKNIKRCVNSLLWVDELIVIDDYSGDTTLDIVRKLGQKVTSLTLKLYQNKLIDFSTQRNFALTKAQNDWVLFIDADEEVSDSLKKEIEVATKTNQGNDGFNIRRNDFFLNSWLKYGETANVRLLRLGKKDNGRWQGKVHEIWEFKGKTVNLNNAINHYPHQTLSEFLLKINDYSSIRATELHQKGIKTNWVEMLFYPTGKFLYNYIFRFGFLDKMPGLIMAITMSFHSFLVRSKLYLLSK